MLTRVVVADSGPLIIWARLGRLELLRTVCGEVWVPTPVEYEAVNDPRRPGATAILTALANGLLVRPPPENDDLQTTPYPTLGHGESAAIRLAMRLKCPVLMDEKRGRVVAKAHNVPVIGTLGVLLIARQDGHIDRIKPVLEQMAQMKYFTSPALHEAVMQKSGEQ
jgi:uncharacterized protein